MPQNDSVKTSVTFIEYTRAKFCKYVDSGGKEKFG